MLLKFEIDTSKRSDVVEVEEMVNYLKSTFAETNPVAQVAQEKNLNAEILGAGLKAVIENTVSDVNETPVPPVSPPLNNTAGIELDSEGLPWDSRIHASSKKKLAKTNTWKLMRGVDTTLVETVKAELKTLMSIPTPAAPAAPAVPAAPVPPNTGCQPAPKHDVTPVPPGPENFPGGDPDALGASQAVTFPLLMTAITEAGLDDSEVTPACQKFGVDSIFLLAARPDLIPSVYSELFE